jgi:hypothetical protein
MFIILLLYVGFEHPAYTYGGFVSAFSEQGMTARLDSLIIIVNCGHSYCLHDS